MKCELCSRKANHTLCDVCGEMIGRLLQIQQRIKGQEACENNSANPGASAAAAR
jgi:ATP/ADP translocase